MILLIRQEQEKCFSGTRYCKESVQSAALNWEKKTFQASFNQTWTRAIALRLSALKTPNETLVVIRKARGRGELMKISLRTFVPPERNEFHVKMQASDLLLLFFFFSRITRRCPRRVTTLGSLASQFSMFSQWNVCTRNCCVSWRLELLKMKNANARPKRIGACHASFTHEAVDSTLFSLFAISSRLPGVVYWSSCHLGHCCSDRTRETFSLLFCFPCH